MTTMTPFRLGDYVSTAPPVVVVTPNSGAIPPPGTIAAAATAGNPVTDWLTGSMFGGIPNWVLAGGLALLLFGGSRR